MVRKAREKHRKETEEAKQSQDGISGQSVQDADTGIVTTHAPAVPLATPGLDPPSETSTRVSKAPGCLHSSVKTQVDVAGSLSCL